ncbi:MAG: hypothetical protein GEU79_03185 [Acidimicrobiia bacterium]|nr:hypothetical protein [Acidimicrobiia bacterium]
MFPPYLQEPSPAFGGGTVACTLSHVSEHPVLRATRWLGVADPDLERFDRFRKWLEDEAIPAGGLGPNEAGRITERHLVDSVLFAIGWPDADPPQTVVDLGSGVGLPALPLALLWPETEVTAVERAGRRVDLLRRVARVLEVQNLVVEQTSLENAPQASMVTMRAVLPPAKWGAIVPHILQGGRGIVAAPANHPRDEDTVVVPKELSGSERVFQVFRTTETGRFT